MVRDSEDKTSAEEADRPYAVPASLDPGHLRAIVRRIWGLSGPSVTSDVLDDCLLEAALCLWTIRGRVAALPPDERSPYSYACVNHAVRRLLLRESRQRNGALSLEEWMTQVEGEASAADDPGAGLEGLTAPELLDQLGLPHLAAAVSALRPREYVVLDLYYAAGLSDAEIALCLGTTPVAAKKRRWRALARLRARLGSATAGPMPASRRHPR